MICIFHPEVFKMNRLLIAFFVLIILVGVTVAQVPPPDYKAPVSTTPADRAVPKQISGGV